MFQFLGWYHARTHTHPFAPRRSPNHSKHVARGQRPYHRQEAESSVDRNPSYFCLLIAVLHAKYFRGIYFLSDFFFLFFFFPTRVKAPRPPRPSVVSPRRPIYTLRAHLQEELSTAVILSPIHQLLCIIAIHGRCVATTTLPHCCCCCGSLCV